MFTHLSQIVDNPYLARSTALRSFFAQSAIRGSTRATLQLRNIWKVEDKSHNSIHKVICAEN